MLHFSSVWLHTLLLHIDHYGRYTICKYRLSEARLGSIIKVQMVKSFQMFAQEQKITLNRRRTANSSFAVVNISGGTHSKFSRTLHSI